MKRGMGLILVLLLVVGMLPVPAVLAAPAPDFSALAAYFPAETPFYMALGTAEADFLPLDALLATVLNAVPGTEGVNLRVTDLLDLALSDAAGTTFSQAVRPWLGDGVAVGIFELETTMTATSINTGTPEDAPFAFAVDLADRPALEAFLNQTLLQGGVAAAFSMKEEGEQTLYTSNNPDDDALLIVRDEVLLLGNAAGMAYVQGGVTDSLGDAAAFNAALDLLPADDYSMVIVVNSEAFQASLLAEAADQGLALAAEDLSTVYPVAAVGLAVLDGKAIALDMAQPLVNAPAADSGAVIYQPLPPLDLDFAVHVPADSLLTIMGSDFSAMVDLLELVVRMGLEQTLDLAALGVEADMPGLESADEMMAQMEQMRAEVDMGLMEAEQAIFDATGLRLREDVIDWMTGDYAFTFRVENDALLEAQPSELPIGIGMVTAATDAGAAQAVLDGLMQALSAANTADAEAVVKQEAVGDGTAIVIQSAPSMVLEVGFPISFMVGADDEVFAFGTRDTVEAALIPANGGLAAEARYIGALPFLVEDTTALWFFNLAALGPAMLADMSPAEAADAALVLNLLDSVTLSGTTYADGSSVARLAIVLNGGGFDMQ
jgi:hypothetical protein